MSKWPYSTRRWERLRRLKLQRDPLCQSCLQLGRIEPAVAIDHRTPIKRGGDAFPALDQLASLCVRCHNAKTRGAGGRGLFAQRLRCIRLSARSEPPVEQGMTGHLFGANPRCCGVRLCRPAQRGEYRTSKLPNDLAPPRRPQRADKSPLGSLL